jgi:hypothetical protein
MSELGKDIQNLGKLTQVFVLFKIKFLSFPPIPASSQSSISPPQFCHLYHIALCQPKSRLSQPIHLAMVIETLRI